MSAGYIAFITLLGVFEKLSEKYKTNRLLKLLETVIILGVVSGNCVHLLQIKLPLKLAGVIIYTFFGGIFVGCLSGALAEVLDIFPILSRKFKVRDYLPYVIIAAALGKGLGSAIQLIFL